MRACTDGGARGQLKAVAKIRSPAKIRMTNDRMTNEEAQISNTAWPLGASFEFRYSDFFRYLAFGFWHSAVVADFRQAF
jgi:hypothetical protein